MNSSDLYQQLAGRLASRSPREIQQPDLAEAGVLVAITDEDEPRLLLTRRASHLSTHQGEVAFPGGKRDPEDESIIATALREAEEEVALRPGDVRVIGVMDQVVSRFGYLVTPVLALIPPGLEFDANEAELDAVFCTPISLFQQPPSSFFEHQRVKIPSFDYQEFHIWGLTAMMITEMMNHLWDADIEYRI